MIAYKQESAFCRQFVLPGDRNPDPQQLNGTKGSAVKQKTVKAAVGVVFFFCGYRDAAEG
jgi:hypothetical protein